MCLLESNATADNGFTEVRQAGDRSDYETRLVQLASEDSVEQAQGLHLTLKPVLSWQRHPQLRSVRKTRIGRHRAYIQGRHIDCRYLVCYIKVHKRDEEDREEDPRFQDIILDALQTPLPRVLTPPASEDAPVAIVLPQDLRDRAFRYRNNDARQSLVQIAKQELINGYRASHRDLPDDSTLDRLARIEVSKSEADYWQAGEQS